jgi:hypothetical protein
MDITEGKRAVGSIPFDFNSGRDKKRIDRAGAQSCRLRHFIE